MLKEDARPSRRVYKNRIGTRNRPRDHKTRYRFGRTLNLSGRKRGAGQRSSLASLSKELTHQLPLTFFVKEEDLAKLMAWEKTFHVPIIVSHLFDQEAFTIRLRRLEQFNKSYESKPKEKVKLQMTTGIFKVLQVYERVDAAGARERKVVFRVAPSAALKIGDIRGVKVSAQLGVSASKKYVAHTLFENGKLLVSKEFLDFLNGLDR